MSGVDKFEVGDRVVMASPSRVQVDDGLLAGLVGTVTRVDGDGIPRVLWDSGAHWHANDDQLEPLAPPRDGRRERIATAVLAGFAADSNTSHLLVRDLAKAAVEWADALIEELER